MTQPHAATSAPTVDPEVKALAEQTVRFLVFVVRWLVRRYGLNITI